MLAISRLKPLSPRDFAMYGRAEMAYVKRVETKRGPAYAVHAADGTYLEHFADREAAVAALRQHDIELLSTH